MMMMIMMMTKKAKDILAFTTHTHTSSALFHRSPDGVTSIELESVDESVWYVKFSGRDPRHCVTSDLKESISAHTLFQLLGAPDDDPNASYSLVPGLLSSGFAPTCSTVIDCNSPPPLPLSPFLLVVVVVRLVRFRLPQTIERDCSHWIRRT